MEPKYHSYKELPICKYIEIKNIIKNEEDETSREIQIIALLCGVSYNEVLEMPLIELSGIRNKLNWIYDNNFNTKIKKDTIIINNNKYKIVTDLSKFTVAQYLDFQQYEKDEEHICENLSTFIIPADKKYSEGYDVGDVIKEFREYLDVETAIALQSFFLTKLLDSNRSMMGSLQKQLKKMKTEKNKDEIEAALKQIEEIQYIRGFR